MSKISVSIIIANYNGKNLLKTIIDSIKSSSFKSYEIMIVDNASTDGSRQFVKKHYKDVKLIANKRNLGYSGINSALKYCKGRYILFLNNDIELDKNCIKNLVAAVEPEDVAMSAPKLINFYDNNLKSNGTWVSRAFYNGHIKGNGNSIAKEIPYLGVGLIKKEFVGMFGYLFDPDYFIYAEDLDLGLRIRLNGKKTMFVPNAIMYHMHAVTMQHTSKAFTAYLMERNLLMTFFKILSIKNIILYLPYALFIRSIAMLRDLAILRVSIALSRLRAILFILLNFGFVLKKRMQVQKFRKANDSYILKVFSEKYLFKPKFIV